MKLTLEIKQKCSFFWLRAIQNVRIDKCCAQCFIGKAFNEIYEQTRYKEKALVEFEIPPLIGAKAYYLCGLSRGMKYENNTHIAFVPDKGETITVDNDLIRVEITDARRIDFEGYIPSPDGEFTDEQRACRNWIFANYIKDGMPL
ncbi:MAG: hypothetical protein IJ711_00330 [Lachnospiraceae bacterium]|nr:hypothetical protein [Clostridia bacterium]MBR1691202.1 hypothetical protein [Lachnospiraceae bacterium]